MIPFILATVGGYFVGSALKDKQIFANGGVMADGGVMARGGKMANGKGENIDLFEFYDQQPPKLSKIINKWAKKYENEQLDYSDTKKFLKEVESVGYTFDYGLDNMPHSLRPIGSKMADGGMTKNQMLDLMKKLKDKNSKVREDAIKEIKEKNKKLAGEMADGGMMARGKILQEDIYSIMEEFGIEEAMDEQDYERIKNAISDTINASLSATKQREIKKQLQENILSILEGFGIEEAMDERDYERIKNAICDTIIAKLP